jgi:uncharacterized RDD family membrane protein YckC
MPCPICGDICECKPAPASDANLLPASESHPAHGSEAASSEDSAAWRQEVAAKLSRYQSKRKPKPPRYPSLRLRFEDENEAARSRTEPSFFPPAQTSNHALAFDNFAMPETVSEPNVADSHSVQPQADTYSEPGVPIALPAADAPTTAKIIEFPRSWTPPLPALDELAEPVVDRPRILDVPEVIPQPPALGGITIEPAPRPDLEKRPGIDVPLQSAPIEKRVLSALIDSVIIAAACGLFGFIFWKLTSMRPPRVQTAGVLAGLGFVLWATYQYLLIVYAGTTPGLRMAGLDLLRFDERRPSRALRRWRVLASFLSAVSLGMGFLWVFLDEDSLCWHDRITHTYLAPTTPMVPASPAIE